jgi:hypothetical protein
MRLGNHVFRIILLMKYACPTALLLSVNILDNIILN